MHDYHDVETGVLASSLARRAPGYISLGFADPGTSVPCTEAEVLTPTAGRAYTELARTGSVDQTGRRRPR